MTIMNSLFGFKSKYYSVYMGVNAALYRESLSTLISIWFEKDALKKWLKLQIDLGHAHIQTTLPSRWGDGANSAQNTDDYEVQITTNGRYRDPSGIACKFAQELHSIGMDLNHSVTLLPPSLS